MAVGQQLQPCRRIVAATIPIVALVRVIFQVMAFRWQGWLAKEDDADLAEGRSKSELKFDRHAVGRLSEVIVGGNSALQRLPELEEGSAMHEAEGDGGKAGIDYAVAARMRSTFQANKMCFEQLHLGA